MTRHWPLATRYFRTTGKYNLARMRPGVAVRVGVGAVGDAVREGMAEGVAESIAVGDAEGDKGVRVESASVAASESPSATEWAALFRWRCSRNG